MSKKQSQSQCNQTFFVEGMHCPSCEVIIEKRLKKVAGVKSVDASLADGKVLITKDDGSKLDTQAINQVFSDLEYRFSEYGKGARTNKVPWWQAPAIALIVLGGYYALETTKLGSMVSVDETSSLPLFFFFGLAAGVSSCAALVGGVLLSMSKQWHELYAGNGSEKRAEPHIMFNVGRLVSFALLGGALGAIGGVIQVSLGFTALLVIVVSLIMAALGLQMMNVPYFSQLKIGLPKSVVSYISSEENFGGRQMPLVLGFLTFFLPCGFTLTAQTIALASGSFTKGAAIMFMFALGTLPMLASISWSSLAFTKKPKTMALFTSVSGILLVVMALYNVNSQLNVLGLPSLSDVPKLVSVGAKAKVKGAAAPLPPGGVQLMQLEATTFEYNPTSFVIRAGVKTRLEVYNSGAAGCAQAMAARGLFPGVVYLKPGMNVVEFTPQKGRYKISCSMGMVPPVTVEVR